VIPQLDIHDSAGAPRHSDCPSPGWKDANHDSVLRFLIPPALDFVRDPRQENQDVGHRVFRIVEKLNVGSPATQLWRKPGVAMRVLDIWVPVIRVLAVRVFVHPDEPRRYPLGLLPEFAAQALFPLPPGFPQREGDSCDGPGPRPPT